MASIGERSPADIKAPPQHRALGIQDEEVQALYAKMVLVRTLDERLWALNRQGRVPIVASCQGAEAAEMAIAWAGVKDGDCFFFTYYRDMALKLMAGVTPLEIMISHLGKGTDIFSGGRQFFLQGASLKHRIIQTSNVVGSSLTQAVGYGLGCKLQGERTVTLVSFGDGASSEGEWHEAMNFASIHQVPVVFLCYNNGLAISVPLTKQMHVRDLADRAAAYNMPGVVVDGTDPLEAYKRIREAIDRAREPGGGPTLIELKVERIKPHTSDDDHTRYRTSEEIEALERRDPLPRLHNYLMDAGLLTAEEAERIEMEAAEEVDRVTDEAELEPWPDETRLRDHLYAP